jgi:hypothetical protein
MTTLATTEAVVQNVDLTAIVDIRVAICESILAFDFVLSRYAASFCVRRGAYCVTTAAMCSIGSKINLAAVGGVSITICKTGSVMLHFSLKRIEPRLI